MKKTSTLTTILGGALLALFSGCANLDLSTHNQTQNRPSIIQMSNNVRVRANLNQDGYSQTTIGVAPIGSYDRYKKGSSVTNGNFDEFFRSHVTNDYTAAGFKLPKSDILGIDSSGYLIGVTDYNSDSIGIGLETKHAFNDLIEVGWNLEGKDNYSLIGGELIYNFNKKLHIGVAFDSMNSDLVFNQYLVNGVYDFNDNFTFGVGYVTNTLGEQSITSFLCKHDRSKEIENMGFRVFGRYDWDDSNRNFDSSLILSQNSETGRGGATFLIGRDLIGAYNQSLIPPSINNVESPSIAQRSRQGFTIQTSYGFNDNIQTEGFDSQYFNESVGYMTNGHIGTYLGVSHIFGESIKTTHTINTGVVFEKSRGILDVRLDIPLNTEISDFQLNIGAGVRF